MVRATVTVELRQPPLRAAPWYTHPASRQSSIHHLPVRRAACQLGCPEVWQKHHEPPPTLRWTLVGVCPAAAAFSAEYALMWHSKSFCQQFGLPEAAIEAEFLACDVRCTHRRAALLTRLRRYGQAPRQPELRIPCKCFPESAKTTPDNSCPPVISTLEPVVARPAGTQPAGPC
jgi:hypothetical protein